MANESPAPKNRVVELLASLEQSLAYAKAAGGEIASERWLREQFPEKDWHHHARTDGRMDLCDGTPSDCAEKVRL